MTTMTPTLPLAAGFKLPTADLDYQPTSDLMETDRLNPQITIPSWRLFGQQTLVSTSMGSVYHATVDQFPDQQLPGKSLKDVIAGAKTKDEKGRLAVARKELADVQLASGVRQTLKQHRLRAGMSQAELAGRLGTSQSYVARLEKGEIANPKLDRLRQISRVLDINVEDLTRALHG